MRQRLSEKCKEKRRLRSVNHKTLLGRWLMRLIRTCSLSKAFRECASRDARAPNRPANSLLLSSIKRSKELKSSARAAVNSETDTRKASVANAPARRPVIGPNAHRTSMRSPVALRSHGSIHMRALGTVARRHENNPSSQQTLEGVCLSLLRPFRMLGLDRVLASIRVSLSLLPLGLSKSAIYGISRLRLLLWLLAPPLAVLVTVLAANAERTPFTGRWRIPLLAATQQQQLFEQLIQHSGRGDSGEIDWSQVLRKVSQIADRVLHEEKEPTTDTTERRCFVQKPHLQILCSVVKSFPATWIGGSTGSMQSSADSSLVLIKRTVPSFQDLSSFLPRSIHPEVTNNIQCIRL